MFVLLRERSSQVAWERTTSLQTSAKGAPVWSLRRVVIGHILISLSGSWLCVVGKTATSPAAFSKQNLEQSGVLFSCVFKVDH